MTPKSASDGLESIYLSRKNDVELVTRQVSANDDVNIDQILDQVEINTIKDGKKLHDN